MSEEKERSFDQEYDEWIKGLQEKIRAESKSFMDRQDKLIMDSIKRATGPNKEEKMGGLFPIIEPGTSPREDKEGDLKEKIIKYIEQAEILIPIEMFFNADKSHITKQQYGKILIGQLCQQLRNYPF